MKTEEAMRIVNTLARMPFAQIRFSLGDFSVHLVRDGSNVQDGTQGASHIENAQVSEKTGDGGKTIDSPIIGVFYVAPAPEKPPFVMPGDTVSVGQTVCIVETMKVMNEIKSPIDGVIEAVLVENESEVECGQPLFSIKSLG
jgi:acetyl-CoA carboxylase biotin carboxyl carrier protein